MNNAFVLMEADRFAERLRKEAGADPVEQVDLAFQLALSRKAKPDERDEAVAFLRSGGSTLTDFCQIIFNLNEFAFIP
jgi:hypothetical protein